MTTACYLLACVLAVIALVLWMKAGVEACREDWAGENRGPIR